jgi:hypothetical protein
MAPETPVAHLALGEPPVLAGFGAGGVDKPFGPLGQIGKLSRDAPIALKQLRQHESPVA